MGLKVAVWGTGNVGRPAIRAVQSHSELELAAVIVANPDKVGQDAGTLAGIDSLGISATDDWQAVLGDKPDAMVYAANADIRPEEAQRELLACLSAGINVVATGFYAFLHPGSTAGEVLEPVASACEEGGSSLFVSGIDPGWAMDMLPAVLSGAVADIREIRAREIFNYALYDQPQVVREVIGFGGSMDTLPIMLHDFAIEMVWGPMLRLVGDALGKPVEEIEIVVERRPLESDIEVPGMGLFEAGSQGAFRFEARGISEGIPRYVVEHVTRIDDGCATDWPYPPEGRGCHQVIVSGTPTLTVSLHAEDACEPGAAGGGNATAASWVVNAIPGVCAASPGVVTVLDLPPIRGAAQLSKP
ncbi:MAG: hypothetical protein QNI86_02290 [Halieaceae bacterium]|nr:hypothetical protein [Halieaceae bacterium]